MAGLRQQVTAAQQAAVRQNISNQVQ